MFSHGLRMDCADLVFKFVFFSCCSKWWPVGTFRFAFSLIYLKKNQKNKTKPQNWYITVLKVLSWLNFLFRKMSVAGDLFSCCYCCNCHAQQFISKWNLFLSWVVSSDPLIQGDPPINFCLECIFCLNSILWCFHLLWGAWKSLCCSFLFFSIVFPFQPACFMAGLYSCSIWEDEKKK